jgi:peptidoglycan/xylan/chitin deacetylase (PgdA/CDA1 family)
MFYKIKIPWLLRKLAPSLIYNITNQGKTVFITFDDGPIPETTPEILKILDSFRVEATFFCLGKNVKKNQDLFNKIVNAGHNVGNHSYNHKSGWGSENKDYFNDIEKASDDLFGLLDNILLEK